MDANLQKVIDKINKLRSLSLSANINEATNAAAAANKLIEQHRIAEADLNIDVSETDPMEEDSDYIYETGRITPWRSTLVGVLARHYGVAYFNDVTRAETGRKTSRYKLVGRRSDINIVNYMYAWLTIEIQRLSGTLKGSGHVFINSYCEGFVSGIDEQLKASRVEAQAGASEQAIVKLNSRYQESRQFMYGKYNLRKTTGSSSSQRDNTAYSFGQQGGKSIHLGSALGSSSRGPKLLNK